MVSMRDLCQIVDSAASGTEATFTALGVSRRALAAGAAGEACADGSGDVPGFHGTEAGGARSGDRSCDAPAFGSLASN